MINGYRKTKLWLLIGLLAVVLVACSPAAEPDEAAEVDAATDVFEDQEAAVSNDTSVDEVDEAPAATADDLPDDVSDDVAETEPTEEPEVADELDDMIDTSAGEGSGAAEADAKEESEEDEKQTAKGKTILTDDSRSDVMVEITQDWITDWNRHTVPYDELLPVLFRDAIRSLDEPTFQSLDEAARWLTDEDPVIAVELAGEARAYPLRILSAHEIVNDNFGDRPVVVTYCPLCNSALVFDANFDGQVLEFGTSGWLRNSDLVMYDRTTDTLWQQFTGEGIVGEYAGERLTFLASSLVSFSDFQDAFPEGQVLSNDTGFAFPYDLSSYSGYDTVGSDPYLFFDVIDKRLPAMERVVSISLENLDIAYPVSTLARVGVVNDNQDGQDLVLFHKAGTTSAFFNPITNRFEDVGATGIFDPNLDGQLLTFSLVEEEIVDEQTGSTWNILGQAVDGPLAGESLSPILHGDHFWFSWAAFKPDTLIYSV